MIVRSRQQWLDLFKKHDASGLNAATFCRQEKLCPRYFSKRKKQLGWPAKEIKKIVKKPISNDFIKVSVSKDSGCLSLEYATAQLRFSQLPPADYLSDLIKALR